MTPPNILYIVSDDQRADMFLSYMPNVRNLVASPGREFTSCRTNIGWCQPSRAGFFAGLNHQHHGLIKSSKLGNAAWNAHLLDGYDHNENVAKWLQDVAPTGYRTAMIGKYLNTAPETAAEWVSGGSANGHPDGWSVWRQLSGGGLGYRHLGYTINDGSGAPFAPVDANGDLLIQMDYLQQEAIAFINGVGRSEGDPVEPWFLYLAPSSPHSDYAPAPEDLFAWSHIQWPIDLEEDVSDKPSWIQALPPLSSGTVSTYLGQARGQLRELKALDRAIGAIVDPNHPGSPMSDALLDRTIVFYASDNGLHYGEHRRSGSSTKNTPYEAAMRIPLAVRGPGFDPGLSEANVTVTDITATIVQAAGATPPAGYGLDGVDLADVVANPAVYATRPVLHAVAESTVNLSSGGTLTLPYGEGLTTTTVRDSEVVPCKFFRYPSQSGADRYEAYYLDVDPDELDNVGSSIQGFAALDASLNALTVGSVPIIDEHGAGIGPTVAFNATPADGKTMIVVARHSVAAPLGVTAGAPSGWSAAAIAGQGTPNAAVIWWKRAAGESSPSFTLTGGSIQWYRYLVSNLDPAPVNAMCVLASAINVKAATPGPFPMLAAKREFVVVGALQVDINGGGEAVSDDFTARDVGVGEVLNALVVGDRITTSPVAPNPTLSWTTLRNAKAVGAAFKAAAP